MKETKKPTEQVEKKIKRTDNTESKIEPETPATQDKPEWDIAAVIDSATAPAKEKPAEIVPESVTEESAPADADPKEQKPKPLIIKLDDLVPFKDHPYKVLDNAEMDELVKSIKEVGVINPIIARPLDGTEGQYEIISGHRRVHAAKKLGLKKVQCTVHYIDRDAATLLMVESNSQRTELLPSEKAFAYRMRTEALSRQNKPVGPVVPQNGGRATETVGAENGESYKTVQRYIRLTYLVPELLDFVDKGKIKLRPAVEISYLPEEVQRDIVDVIDGMGGETFPSHAQTRLIRRQAESKEGISHEQIEAILSEPKPNQVEKVKIPVDDLRKRVKRNMTDAEFIEYLYKTVDFYEKHLERQREQAR